jgi:hypothetical protein
MPQDLLATAHTSGSFIQGFSKRYLDWRTSEQRPMIRVAAVGPLRNLNTEYLRIDHVSTGQVF